MILRFVGLINVQCSDLATQSNLSHQQQGTSYTAHTSYNLNQTRVDLMSCTCMFLSSFKCNYTHYSLSLCIGLHAHVFITLFTSKVLFYMHTHMLAVIYVITTCTSIDLPQLDQVMHADAYKCFDHKHGLLLIASAYNSSINQWLARKLVWICETDLLSLVSNMKMLKNCRFITVRRYLVLGYNVALCISYIVCMYNHYKHVHV